MASTNAILAVLIALGILVVNPQIMLIGESFFPDFTVRQTIGQETTAIPITSGEFKFEYSDSLADSEARETGITYNGESFLLPVNKVVELDEFVHVRYEVNNIRQFSSGAGIREMEKSFDFFLSPDLLSSEFNDQFNTLPFNAPYEQKINIRNNYPLDLEGALAFTVTDPLIDDEPEQPTIIKTIYKEGVNNLEVPIKTDSIGGARLETSSRVVFDWGQENDFAIVQLDSAARVYDIKPNIASPRFEPEREPRERTKFFSNVGSSVQSGNVGGIGLNAAVIFIAIALSVAWIITRKK